jgi:hypothetical protein
MERVALEKNSIIGVVNFVKTDVLTAIDTLIMKFFSAYLSSHNLMQWSYLTKKLLNSLSIFCDDLCPLTPTLSLRERELFLRNV